MAVKPPARSVTVPLVLISTLLGASLLLSMWILHDGIRGLTRSEAEIMQSFHGAAQMDVFGFGFWITWAILAVVQLPLLGLPLLIAPRRSIRVAGILIFCAFLLSSVVWYLGFERAWDLYDEYLDTMPRILR